VKRGEEQVFTQTESSAELQQTGEQLTIEKLLNLSSFPPGKYKIELVVTDRLSGQTLNPAAEFTVKAAAEGKTAAQLAPGR